MEAKPQDNEEALKARREFLATCGKFAVATPPAITLMLADAERALAVASSGTTNSGNNGFGNGGGDGVPGRSGSNPSPNADQKAADEER